MIRIEIKSDTYVIAGTKIGQNPDNIRKVLGVANKEGISDELGNFEMINKEDESNQYEMNFAASDFRSPIDYILVSQIITEPTYTLEEKEMIKGKWILEELMDEGDLDTLTVIDDKNFTVDSTYLDSQSEYQITAPNVLEFPTYNSISDEHGWVAQNFEILEDGERLEIYSIDSFTGEIKEGTHKVYYKYSDLTN